MMIILMQQSWGDLPQRKVAIPVAHITDVRDNDGEGCWVNYHDRKVLVTDELETVILKLSQIKAQPQDTPVADKPTSPPWSHPVAATVKQRLTNNIAHMRRRGNTREMLNFLLDRYAESLGLDPTQTYNWRDSNG
jgi:hypothetical protein